jgi:hypothetical protein
MALTQDVRRPLVLFAVALVALTGFPPAVRSQPPRPGDVQTLTAISLSLYAASTEQESRKVTYTPPPGWVIRSHAVQCTYRYGNVSFAISTVPANWAWFSEDRLNESSRQRLDLAAKSHDVGAEARLRHERDATLRQNRQAGFSHNALILEASAKGGGLFRGGAAIELTVTAELVYVGTGTPRRPAVLLSPKE